MKCQQQAPACQGPSAVLGTACWPCDPRSNTAMDEPLPNADVQNTVIPSCVFSPPILSGNNHELPKNSLPFQHAQK